MVTRSELIVVDPALIVVCSGDAFQSLFHVCLACSDGACSGFQSPRQWAGESTIACGGA